MSGRVSDVEVVLSNRNVVYVGSASGGVWKSDDDTFVGHGGSCPGYRSHLLLRPQDKVATAFMTNGQGVNSRQFAQTAFDIVAPALQRAEKRSAEDGEEGFVGESCRGEPGGNDTQDASFHAHSVMLEGRPPRSRRFHPVRRTPLVQRPVPPPTGCKIARGRG